MNINPTRLTGLATGMDTDNMVKQMMKPYQMKLDKVKQDRQIIQWRQELYRDILKDVNNFSRNYFDVLKADTFMLSKNSFSPLVVEGLSNNNINVVASSNAKSGDYKISNIILAEGPKAEGTKVINKVTASSPEFGVKIDETNNEFKVTLADGTSKNIKIPINTVTGYNRYSNVSEVTSAINNELKVNSLSDKVKAVVKDGNIEMMNLTKIDKDSKIKFTHTINGIDEAFQVSISEGNYTADELAAQINSKLSGLKSENGVGFPTGKTIAASVEDTDLSDGINKYSTVFKIGSDIISVKNNEVEINIKPSEINLTEQGGPTSTDISTDAIKNKMIFKKEIISGFNDTLNIRIGTELKTVVISDGTTLDNLEANFNAALIGAGVNNTDLQVKILDGKVNFISESEKQISIFGNASAVAGAYENFDINMKANNKMSNIINTNVKFRINDVAFEYDFTQDYSETSPTGAKNKTISDIISDIKTKTGVDITYSEITKKFSLSTGKTGVNSSVYIEDVSGDFFKSILGDNVFTGPDSTINSKTLRGKDATFTLTTPSGSSVYSKASNIISVDGITITLNGAPSGDVTFKITSNPNDAVTKIKDFVQKYNDLIDKIDKKVSEKKQYKYLPLTEEQKKQMSEDEIKKWEEKAKEGLLKGESDLTTMLSTLRGAFFQPVSGVNLGLREIGLDTSKDYTEKGKIIIDETKLREALKNKGDEVAQFFSKQSQSHPTYTGNLTDAERKTRNNEEGIFQRLNDILKDYTRTTSGKGNIVLKAGIQGDFTEVKNTLSDYLKQKDKLILDMEKKLFDKENKFYSQFAKLEKAMNQMNSQSAWLMQQFGGGSS